MSGDPTIKGTRVLAETILAYLRAGHSREEIHEDYPTLPADGIGAVLRWDAQRQIDAMPDEPHANSNLVRKGSASVSPDGLPDSAVQRLQAIADQHSLAGYFDASNDLDEEVEFSQTCQRLVNLADIGDDEIEEQVKGLQLVPGMMRRDRVDLYARAGSLLFLALNKAREWTCRSRVESGPRRRQSVSRVVAGQRRASQP